LPQKYKEWNGFINGEVKIDNCSENQISGNIKIDSVRYKNLVNDIDTKLAFSLTDSLFNITNLVIRKNENKVFDFNGFIGLLSPHKIQVYGKGKGVKFTDILHTDFFESNLNCSALITGNLENPKLLFNGEFTNGKLHNTHFARAKIQFFQDTKTFYLNKLKVESPEDFFFTGKGKYSYNIFSRELNSKPDGVNLHFTGDLLSLISDYSKSISGTNSDTEIDLLLTSEEKGITIKKGKFSLVNGEMQLKGQPAKIEDIELVSFIKEKQGHRVKSSKPGAATGPFHRANNLNGSFSMANGSLVFKNKIENKDSDIIIGGVNFGTILLTSPHKGISINVPGYIPEGSIVEAKLTGFDDNYFKVLKEGDQLKFAGKVIFSNGKAMYNKKKEKGNGASFFSQTVFDVELVFQENVWFVGHPFNLYIDEGNYISIESNLDNNFSKVFFDLHSSKGEMLLFGQTFQAEDVSVSCGRNDNKVLINATFKKKTAEGSVVYLYVNSTAKGNRGNNYLNTEAYGNVQVRLSSDNPDDKTMLSILSKLQYGKSLNELDEQERNSLGKDEVINLATDELRNLLISPVLSPVEGAVRKFLGLDFFRLKTGLMKNLIRKSGIVTDTENFFDEKNADESDINKIGYWGRDVILDDLSVDMGKYITSDWYVNYEAKIQRGLNLANEVDYGLQHKVTFRYDLPWNLRILYMYRYSPLEHENIQKITLEAFVNF